MEDFAGRLEYASSPPRLEWRPDIGTSSSGLPLSAALPSSSNVLIQPEVAMFVRHCVEIKNSLFRSGLKT